MQHPIMEKPISQLEKSECKKAYILLRTIRDAFMKEDILFDAFQIARLEANLAQLAIAMKCTLAEAIQHYQAVPHLLQKGGFDLSMQKWLELVAPSRACGQNRNTGELTCDCSNMRYQALLEHPIARNPISMLSPKECLKAMVYMTFIKISPDDELYTPKDYIQQARLYFQTAQLAQRIPFCRQTIVTQYQEVIKLLNKGGFDLSLKKWAELASLRSTDNPDIPDE